MKFLITKGETDSENENVVNKSPNKIKRRSVQKQHTNPQTAGSQPLRRSARLEKKFAQQNPKIGGSMLSSVQDGFPQDLSSDEINASPPERDQRHASDDLDQDQVRVILVSINKEIEILFSINRNKHPKHEKKKQQILSQILK